MAWIIRRVGPGFVSQRICGRCRDIRLQTRAARTNPAYIAVFKWLRRPNGRATRTNNPQESHHENWIKTSIAAAIIATGAIGSTAALAWGGHCDGPRGGKAGWSQMAPEQMKAKMAARAELHMARLELALVLAPERSPPSSASRPT